MTKIVCLNMDDPRAKPEAPPKAVISFPRGRIHRYPDSFPGDPWAPSLTRINPSSTPSDFGLSNSSEVAAMCYLKLRDWMAGVDEDHLAEATIHAGVIVAALWADDAGQIELRILPVGVAAEGLLALLEDRFDGQWPTDGWSPK